jgi:hypothetical protein
MNAFSTFNATSFISVLNANKKLCKLEHQFDEKMAELQEKHEYSKQELKDLQCTMQTLLDDMDEMKQEIQRTYSSMGFLAIGIACITFTTLFPYFNAMQVL